MNRQQRRASRKDGSNGSGQWTEEMVGDLLTDPAAIGIGGFPPIVDDEQWIRVNLTMMKEMGAEAFLRNLIRQLRKYD